MTVAIVDDEKKEIDILSEYFKKLQKDVQDDIVLHTFSNGRNLLEDYDYSYDLICLDIDMKGMDGIHVAREIRKMDEQVLLIFVTNMAQMAIQGYAVRAFDFVLKPVDFFSFAMKMRNVIQIINTKKERNIVLTTPGGIQKISTNDLYYAEVSGHYVYYYTKQGTFKQKHSLSELEEKVKGLSFKKCNQCYLVNLKYVSGVNRDDLQVAGHWLKISRPKKKEFLQALANYMGGIEI